MSIYAMFVQSESSHVRLRTVTNATNNRDNDVIEIFSKYQNFNDMFSKKQTNALTFYQNVNHVIELKKMNHRMNRCMIYLWKNWKFYANILISRWKKSQFVISSIWSMRPSFLYQKKWQIEIMWELSWFKQNSKKKSIFLLLIIQILNQLNDSLYFIKIDFKNVYYRIKIRRDDEWKIAFKTRYDHFEYLMMSFDFVNASVIFQTYINKTLIEVINIFCVIYLNDILIFSKNKKSTWLTCVTYCNNCENLNCTQIWRNVIFSSKKLNIWNLSLISTI